MNCTLSFYECRLSAEVVGTLNPYLLTPEPSGENFHCLIFGFVILVKNRIFTEMHITSILQSHIW